MAHPPFGFLFSQIHKCPWADFVIKKKNYCEKLKIPFDLKFKIVDFKYIFVVSPCILIFFIIFVQIPKCPLASIIIAKKPL